MAKLSSALLSKVVTGALPRIKGAQTVTEAIATVHQRLASATLVSEQDVLARSSVSGLILQGASDATTLTGKNGTGRPHVALRNQFMLATPAQVASFLTSLSALTTVNDVQEAYYGFIDTHSINAVIWDNESAWALFKNSGLTFSGYLRADATTGDVSIAGLTPEKPARVINARPLTLEDTAPQATVGAPAPAPSAPAPAPAPAPSAPVMKNLNGQSFTVEALKGSGWSQAQIDALPNA